MDNKHLFYSLFPHCFIVEGKEKIIIYNSQRRTITYVTRAIVDLLNIFSLYTISEIEDLYKNCRQSLVDVIAFLKNKNLIFKKEKTDIFPNLLIDSESPEKISTCVVEYSNKYNFGILVESMEALLVKYLELRFTSLIDSTIKNYLHRLAVSPIRSIQIIADYSLKKEVEDLYGREELPKIVKIIYYNSKSCQIIFGGSRTIVYTKDSYETIKNANNNFKNNLIFNLYHFIESHKYNTYYYKRLSINSDGDIMNCLKNSKIFGNINNDNISEVISKDNFREFWYACPDKIIDIKDSELRYNMFLTNDLFFIKGDCLYKILE